LDVGPLLALHHRDGDHPHELDHRSGNQQHSGDETERRCAQACQRSSAAMLSGNSTASNNQYSHTYLSKYQFLPWISLYSGLA